MVKYYIVPFGSSGDKTTVPNASQVDGTVSYTDGYGEDYSLPLDSDPSALAPERDKWNQLWYDVTLNLQQYQQHGVPEFITSADNGGSAYPYDVGAVVRNGGVNYICTSAANTNTPPGVGWVVFDGVNVTGNAATATALQTARNIGGVSFNGTADITPTNIVPASETSDTTCFLAFFTAASASAQQPKYSSALAYNSSTNALTATTFVGALTGNADTATLASTVTVADAAGDTTMFVMLAGSATGSLPVLTDAGLSYNATTNALTATTFVGALTGNADTATLATTATTAITATNVSVSDAGGDTTTWVMLAGSQTGNQGVLTDGGLTYQATTNALTATTFIGALTGNASTATALATARAIGGVNFDGTADITPTNITPASEAADTTCFLAFFTAASATAQQPKYNSGLAYNASTNALTATTFVGALTGNVTGNVSGSSGSCTGLAATATALGTARSIYGNNFDGTAAISSNIVGTGNYYRFGPTTYAASSYPAANNAYMIIDKAATASDSSIVLRDQGAARAEFGMIGDNDVHMKTVTGVYGSEVFTDRMLWRTNGNVDVVNGGLFRNYATSGVPKIIAGNSDGSTAGAGLEMQYDFTNTLGILKCVEWGNTYRELDIYSNGLKVYFQAAGGATLVGTFNASGYTGALASAVTATTQSQRTNSTTVATTAYVDTEASGVPQNSQSVDYTAVLSDAGKAIYQTGASKTCTIPANASVAYAVGTTLMFECANATGMTIAITSDTLNSTLGSGSRTLAQYGVAFAHKVTSTSWIISGSGLT